jgi:hypothetical protein
MGQDKAITQNRSRPTSGRSIPLPEPEFVNLTRSQVTDSQLGGPVRQPHLTYRPARLHRLAESIPGSLNVYKFGLCSLWKTRKVSRILFVSPTTLKLRRNLDKILATIIAQILSLSNRPCSACISYSTLHIY